MFGDIPGGVIGRDFDEIIHILWEKDYADEVTAIFRRTMETGEPYVAPERAEVRADSGRVEYYTWRLVRLLLPDGRFGVVCCFQDISERKRAEEYSQLLASIVESSSDAIVSKNLNSIVVSWNRGAEVLFGYTAAEMIGKSITLLIPSDRQDEEESILTRIRKGERVEHYETVRRRKDGTLVDVSLAVSPVRGANGKIVGASKIARDITQSKQAEATRQLLLNELNHRVKNTLANVQAILQQTLRTSGNPADFATRFTGRIQSLSRVHALLTDTKWQGADLRDLIRDQLPQEDRVTAWGPTIRLDSQMALHLALMLHELGTNSSKYGALSSSKGGVSVSWMVDDDRLHLRWVERGGPTVSAPSSRGFGTTLIEQSSKSQGGSARMLFEAEGVSWDIALPLPQTAMPITSFGTLSTGRPGLDRNNSDPEKPQALLLGRRVLVIEDEPLVALMLTDILQDAGADSVQTVGTEREALQAIANSDAHLALLDANLHGRPAAEIAAALTRRRIPFVFVTGYGRAGVANSFKHVPVVPKPFTDQQLLDAIGSMIQPSPGVVRLKS